MSTTDFSEIVFNGKFLTAAPTGVHRVAEALIREVDNIVKDQPAQRMSVVSPRDAKRTLDLARIAQRKAGALTWQPWEQFELPFLARGALLVNLCNLGPLAGGDSITMIHDAQVFETPDSYGRAFRTWYQFALPRLGARALKILTVSEYSKARLAHYGVAPLDKIEVIYNGCDHLAAVAPKLEIVERLGLGPNRYVVALSTTQAHKNIKTLISAFAQPGLAGAQLVLVGGALADSFIQLGVRPTANVVFAGRVSDGQLRALLEQSACLAFPSTTEGFGLPPMEAMYLGCPVAVAPRGALPEVCGEAAIYVPPHDTALWTEALQAFIEDPALRERASAAGRQRAQGFTWRASAARLLGVLSESRTQAR